MASINDSLSKIQGVDGFIGAALVDSESGMTLGILGGAGVLNLEIAAAGNTEVVRAKRKTMKNLALRDDIEDILITLGKQYHLIRPLKSRPGVFFYVALERSRANLAMARFQLADAEKDITLLDAASPPRTLPRTTTRRTACHADAAKHSPWATGPDYPGR